MIIVVESIKCKVRVLCPLPGVYASYQPVVGRIYDADYRKSTRNPVTRSGNTAVCAIKIRDKSICLRTGEYEILKEGAYNV